MLEFAQAVSAEGPLPADAAGEQHELAASFVELSGQQREVARAFAATLEGARAEPGAEERSEDARTEQDGNSQRADPLMAGGDPDRGSR